MSAAGDGSTEPNLDFSSPFRRIKIPDTRIGYLEFCFVKRTRIFKCPKEGTSMYKICHTEESSSRQRELEHGLLKALGEQPYEK